MKNSLESQKEKMKERISKLIDEHYEEFSKRSKQPGFTINEMEEVMLGQQKKMRETLGELNGELISSIEPEVKKNVPSAEIVCDEPKKTKR